MTSSFQLTVNNRQFTVIDHWSLTIDNSLKIACPALNPERSSLHSDYGASRFSAGDNCKLKIEPANGAVL